MDELKVVSKVDLKVVSRVALMAQNLGDCAAVEKDVSLVVLLVGLKVVLKVALMAERTASSTVAKLVA